MTGSSSGLGLDVELGLGVGDAGRGVYFTDDAGAQADNTKTAIKNRLELKGSRKLRSIFYLLSDMPSRK